MVIRDQETIRLLRTFGYTERGAQFLYLVGKHSRVWTMQQFCTFSGLNHGDSTARLSERALSFGHAQLAAVRKGSRPAIYRMTKRLHDIIGRESATCPQRDSEIRARLMCLDFIVANSGKDYLHTERDKINHFSAYAELLPSRKYSGVGRGGTHPFVENYPIMVEEGRAEFVYINHCGMSAFRRFAKSYKPLLAALGHSRLIFVCMRVEDAHAAAGTFDQILRGLKFSDEMVGEFAERERLENIGVSDLDYESAMRLRDLRAAKSSFLFIRWKRQKSIQSPVNCDFVPFVLNHGHKFLQHRENDNAYVHSAGLD